MSVCGARTRASQRKFVLTALVLCFVMGYMCSSLEKQHTKEHIIVTVVEELDAVGDKVCNSVAALHLPAGHRQQTQRPRPRPTSDVTVVL